MNLHTSLRLCTGVLICGALAIGGCKSVSQVGEPAAPSASSKLYRLQTDDLTISKDETAVAQLSVVAVSPWKLNEAYPTKLELSPQQANPGISIEKDSYGGSDIAYQATKATVAVSVRGEKQGESSLNGTVKFSLCRADQCILRESAVSWRVRVTAPPR